MLEGTRVPPRLAPCIRGLLHLCMVASLSGGPGVAAAQTRDWPSERPPGPLAARDTKFPPYEVRTLPNGLQVVAVLHHEQPVVSMRLLVRAGSASDPKAKLGLAQLLASLLDQGTTTKSAQEINDAIDFIGGAMGAGAGTDLTFLHTLVMKDSFETGMRMLSDMARHSAFAPAEIDRQRQQMVSGLRVSVEDPGWVANAVFDRLVYGFHPYGMPDRGTPETLAGITRDDLVAFHSKYFAPNNAILAIVGDVTTDEAFSTVAKVFGDWQRRDVPQEQLTEPPEPTRRVIVVNKPDAVQTEVRVGHLGISRKNDDYMPMNLAIRVLGGEGSNRLHQVLRTERSLTYGAQASLDTFKDSGDIEIETNTRSEATGEVLKVIVDEFSRLQRDRVGERELAEAKAYLTGSFPLTIETPESIATQVLNVLFYGLPLDHLRTFRERVNAVTVDDIQRVARYYLKPDRLSVVLVGNAEAFASQLKGVGFNRYETVEIQDLDLTAANFKRPARRADGSGRSGGPGGSSRSDVVQDFGSAVSPVRPAVRRVSYQQPPDRAPNVTPAAGVTATTLLDREIAAKGGLDRLRSVKSIKAVTSASMTAPSGPVEAETTTYIEYPNHVRVEAKLPRGSQTQGYDGEHGWVRDPLGVHDVPAEAIRGLEDGLRRDVIAALLAAERGDLRTRILPDVKDEGGRLHHALEMSSPDFEPLVFYIDPTTNLIAKQTFAAGGLGQPLVEEIFSDYRGVDGVQVAFAAELRRGGQSLLRHVTAITINPPIDSALFKRPGS